MSNAPAPEGPRSHIGQRNTPLLICLFPGTGVGLRWAASPRAIQLIRTKRKKGKKKRKIEGKIRKPKKKNFFLVKAHQTAALCLNVGGISFKRQRRVCGEREGGREGWGRGGRLATLRPGFDPPSCCPARPLPTPSKHPQTFQAKQGNRPPPPISPCKASGLGPLESKGMRRWGRWGTHLAIPEGQGGDSLSFPAPRAREPHSLPPKDRTPF